MYQHILAHWRISNATLIERFHPESDRIICHFATEEGRHLLLRGLPDGKPEAVIRSNTAAHLFLGNRHGIAQPLLPLPDGSAALHLGGYWYYLLAYIEGRQLEETPEDTFALAQLARRLHSLTGFDVPSDLSANKSRFYSWFHDKPFKAEFDVLLDSLPDFTALDQCFIHSDLGPHNSVMTPDGRVMLIDLDDAGIGSRHFDLGWPFIMQYVDFNHDTGDMRYRYDLALAFLRGYYGEKLPDRTEYDALWQGAVYMHVSYMQTYGPYAVDSLWRILQFGLAQKEPLWALTTKEALPW